MRIPRSLILLALILVGACGTSKPTLPGDVAPTAGPSILLPTGTFIPWPTPTMFTTIDDFEASETAWKAGTVPDYADSSALSVALTSEHASQGKQALQLNFEQNDKPKAIFFLDQPLDLSQARFVQFDIYNPGTVSGVGIAVTTGADLVWYESDSFSVEKDKQTSLSFDLTTGTYKAASTNWEFRASIADLNSVSRLAIIIYPAQSGSVFVDNLRLGNKP